VPATRHCFTKSEILKLERWLSDDGKAKEKKEAETKYISFPSRAVRIQNARDGDVHNFERFPIPLRRQMQKIVHVPIIDRAIGANKTGIDVQNAAIRDVGQRLLHAGVDFQ